MSQCELQYSGDVSVLYDIAISGCVWLMNTSVDVDSR